MEVKIHIYFIRWNTVSRKVANILIILFTDDFKKFPRLSIFKKGRKWKRNNTLESNFKKEFPIDLFMHMHN